MTPPKQGLHWAAWAGLVVAGLGILGAVIAYRMTVNHDTAMVHAGDVEAPPQRLEVKVIHPAKGAMERLSTQPGSIQAYESVRLYAKVPGFLKEQNVDIGARVKKGDILAVVDVPEIETQVQRNQASVEQNVARVAQMQARVDSARADLEAAKAAKVQADATAKSSAAWVRYRSKQFNRMQDLLTSRSIEEKVVDESKEHYEASVESELSAKAAIKTADAKIVAAQAKIEQELADVKEAEAEVKVAKAELAKAEVQLKFATIRAPFDGVITQRAYFPGDFVRSANETGGNEPLLTINRVDKMRVVVSIPDRDVPFTDPGDSAEVEIDALPGKKLEATVSRVASTLDPHTRLMRVELDMPNPTGKIYNGMYGQVTIVLDRGVNLLSLPASCLAEKHDDGKGIVYVVRDGKIKRLPIRIGSDNGIRIAVAGGLSVNDDVVLLPGTAPAEDTEVTAKVWGENRGKTVGGRYRAAKK